MSVRLPRDRGSWLLLAIGLAALLACLLLGRFFSARQALLSYLFVFLFFTGLSVGSLAMLMVHPLTGGAWGYHVRGELLAAARLLPLMAVLVLPILFGMQVLYPWAQADVLAHDSLLRDQTWYLDPTFFVVRSVIYFLVWIVLLVLFSRRLETPERLPRMAAPGLIVFAITSFLAATDWSMSLLPHWHSSGYGMMVATGWMLAATALATLCAMFRPGAGDAHPPQLLHQLGNLLLLFVLGWAYLAFMQYLTIWIADEPAENVWYIPRTLTSWAWLGRFLIVFHFAVPFFILLSRRAKQSRVWMAWVAGMLLVAHLADALWLVVPDFRADALALHWTDLCAVIGVGALWTCLWRIRLRAVRPTSATDASVVSPGLPLEGSHG